MSERSEKSRIDPDSIPSKPLEGESIASVLSYGPAPWFSKRKLSDIIPRKTNDSAHCVCGAKCRCCKKLEDDRYPRDIKDRETIKEEKRQKMAKREQDERELVEKEAKDVQWIKQYFILGCFGLPIVHIIILVRFAPLLKKLHDSNFRIRQYYTFALIVCLTETIIWLVWFILFQTLRPLDQRLDRLNILNANDKYAISSLV